MDSVSDRDYAIEFLSACSILMMHLSRFSEEIILWCSWEFKFVELDDAYSTGSSIMPQKKNPDVAELVRGKTGRVYGDLMTLLTVMKGAAPGLQQGHAGGQGAGLRRHRHGGDVPARVRRHAGHPDRPCPRTCAKAAAGGFINATDCADYLVKKGMPFREAYMIVGRLVNMCMQLRRDPGNPDPAGLPCHQRPVRLRRVRGAGAEDTASTNGRSTAAPATDDVTRQIAVHQGLCGRPSLSRLWEKR